MSALARALRFALSRQANAYGFTLIVWGTGGIAESQLGGPTPGEVVAFVGGALAAAVAVLVVVFGVSTVFRAREPERRAYSAMHLVSVPAAIGSGWGSMLAFGGSAGYAVAAFVAVLVYEGLLSAEIRLAMTGRTQPRNAGGQTVDSKTAAVADRHP